MTGKKVNLAYISNETDRMNSYKKRKNSLIKKARELSTLCGVEACAIVYGEKKEQTTVWPSREGAQLVLEKYQSLCEVDRSINMLNQEGFSEQSIEKTMAQYQRLKRENERNEIELFMHQVIAGEANFDEFDMSRAAEMNAVIQQTRHEINARKEALQGSDGQDNMAPNNANLATNEVAQGHENT